MWKAQTTTTEQQIYFYQKRLCEVLVRWAKMATFWTYFRQWLICYMICIRKSNWRKNTKTTLLIMTFKWIIQCILKALLMHCKLLKRFILWVFKTVIQFFIGNNFVCLFYWSLSSHSRIFHSYGDVTIVGEGQQV